MIIFFENGRLGNQLFQYSGLRHYFPNQKIVFFGCEALNDAFEEIKATFVFENQLGNLFLFKHLRKVFLWFGKIRLLGLITEETSQKKYNINKKKGIIPNIYILEKVFFQHTDNLSQITAPPVLKQKWEEKAKKAAGLKLMIDHCKSEILRFS